MNTAKIGQREASSLLKTAGATIRKLKGELDEERRKVAAFELKDRATTLAKEAHDKGFYQELETVDEKTAHLIQNAERLDVIEEAIRASAPNVKLASVSDDEAGGHDSKAALNHYILTGETA